MKIKIQTGTKYGDRFKVINTNGNGYKLGDIVIALDNTDNKTFNTIRLTDNYKQTVTLGENIERVNIKKEEVIDKIKHLQKEIEDMEERLRFMEITNTDIFDENRYKRYILLKEINSDTTPEEKEEVINSIIENDYNGFYYL